MLFKRQDPYALVVSMTGVKMGDRLLLVGCTHGGRLGATAVKVGLSGRAVAVVADEASAARARAGAADAGALVDVEVGSLGRFEDASFDLVVVDDAAGAIGLQPASDQARMIGEFRRLLRAGGRVIVVGSTPRAGIAAILSRGPAGPPFAASGAANTALQQGGFKSVRTLAEREGLVFVEGIRPRD